MGFFQRRWALPLVIFVVCAAVYCATAGRRLTRPSSNNHYVHLASAWLEGRLDLGPSAPGTNDWACFDVQTKGPCPPGRYTFSGADERRYRWFVSFPPLPAVLLTPVVAAFGLRTLDTLFWALFAGLAPALLFVVLRYLHETGRSTRTERENLLVTGLFAVGSVYYFVAVQGTVWFAAHVVATVFVCLYLWCAFGARLPVLAGLALGLAFLCRPTAALLAPFFVCEALGAAPRDRRALVRAISTFLLPLLTAALLAMAYNVARFGDPLEFGHRFLQIRWRARIESWGLFSTHYLPRNLKVFFLSIPWWLREPPFVRISRHGLALWVTTPNLLWSLAPKTLDWTNAGLWLSVLATAGATLLYQNTGWVQFGPRFALDYLPLLFVLVIRSRLRFGRLFWACAVVAVLVNAFGAVTFDRFDDFYDDDPTQRVIFQSD